MEVESALTMARKINPVNCAGFSDVESFLNLKDQGIFLGIPVVNHHFCSAIINLHICFPTSWRGSGVQRRWWHAWGTVDRKKHMGLHHPWRQPSPQKGENSGHDEWHQPKKTLHNFEGMDVPKNLQHRRVVSSSIPQEIGNFMITTFWGLSTKIVGTYYQCWTFLVWKYREYTTYMVIWVGPQPPDIPHSHADTFIVANTAAV